MRKIPGFEGYHINEFGQVYSLLTNKLLKLDCRQGYYRVKLNRKNVHVGRLMLITFKGESKLKCCYLDGNPLNIHLSNLEWKSDREIQYHACNT